MAGSYLYTGSRPAGLDERKLDAEAMKPRMLNEPDFEPIFNGKDFSGLGFVLGS